MSIAHRAPSRMVSATTSTVTPMTGELVNLILVTVTRIAHRRALSSGRSPLPVRSPLPAVHPCQPFTPASRVSSTSRVSTTVARSANGPDISGRLVRRRGQNDERTGLRWSVGPPRWPDRQPISVSVAGSSTGVGSRMAVRRRTSGQWAPPLARRLGACTPPARRPDPRMKRFRLPGAWRLQPPDR